jgi:hypothetical protein
MSDSTNPTRRVIHDFEIDNLIRAAKETYDGWLERVVKNGPEDLTGINEMAACSARYNQLLSLKRGYLS